MSPAPYLDQAIQQVDDLIAQLEFTAAPAKTATQPGGPAAPGKAAACERCIKMTRVQYSGSRSIATTRTSL